jgi:hypothetical protein
VLSNGAGNLRTRKQVKYLEINMFFMEIIYKCKCYNKFCR